MGIAVVYIHGLWLTGHESFRLRQRLASELGANTHVFSYPSVRGNVAHNAAALGRYLATIEDETLHLVAHSLGGLVLLKYFESSPAAALPPGRVVLLGSPVRGSRSARRLAKLPMGRHLLGRTAHDTLLDAKERRWEGPRDLGIIAGDLGVGLGRLMGQLRAPNDGTVLVDETALQGAADRVTLRVSHTGMQFSPLVAKQTAAFLRNGRFLR